MNIGRAVRAHSFYSVKKFSPLADILSQETKSRSRCSNFVQCSIMQSKLGFISIRLARSFSSLGQEAAFSKDLYKILGVEKNTEKAGIKSAYTKLVKQYHPDLNKDKGSDHMIKDINLAYMVLSNEEKKKEYDQYLAQKDKISDFESKAQRSGGQYNRYGPVESRN
jgi:preprotein translocase subunit Sec63